MRVCILWFYFYSFFFCFPKDLESYIYLEVTMVGYIHCFLALTKKVMKSIAITYPYKAYPILPQIDTRSTFVQLGYIGVYLFFLFLFQNIDCGYSLEPPRRGASNMYPQSMF